MSHTRTHVFSLFCFVLVCFFLSKAKQVPRIENHHLEIERLINHNKEIETQNMDRNQEGNCWRFHQNLGTGGFGVIELWVNYKTQEQIAIKKCRLDVKELADRQKERWIHEVKIMNQLLHDNIIRVKSVSGLNIQNESGLPILIMEYCNKGDLRNVLNEPEHFCGLKEQETFRLMSDVSSAVEYLHSFKITHRDLKPENIVIHQEADQVIYKLIDLGYAKELGETSATASIVGTMNYIAPELFWKKDYSCTVDYWGLGVLFYEILTGTRPFSPTMPMSAVWLDHIKTKDYEHISAHETDGKVQFNTDLDDPNRVSLCIRNEFVDWFRVVLQWNPKKRGKIKDAGPNDPPVVFSMLKEILNTTIFRVFIVPLFKFEAYKIDSATTIRQVKQLIAEQEKIEVDYQILTDAEGRLLLDDQRCSEGIILKDTNFVFHSEKILIGDIPPAKPNKFVTEIIQNPRKSIDQQLKRYYGATIFYIGQELEIYRTFIVGLSIVIDLADAKVRTLRNEIKTLISDTETLMNSSKMLPQGLEANTLRAKVNNLSTGTKNIERNCQALDELNNQMKRFSDIDWMDEISKPYDNAISLMDPSKSDNQKYRLTILAKIIFSFSKIKNERLTSSTFTDTVKKLNDFRGKIIQLEKVIDSFKQLSVAHCEDVDKLILFGDKTAPVELPSSSVDLSIFEPNDSVICESIFLNNLVSEGISNMVEWSRENWSFDEFNI